MLPRAYVGWILFLQNQNNSKSRGGSEKALKGPPVFENRSNAEPASRSQSEPKDRPTPTPPTSQPLRTPRLSRHYPCNSSAAELPPTHPAAHPTGAPETSQTSWPRDHGRRYYLCSGGTYSLQQQSVGSAARTWWAPAANCLHRHNTATDAQPCWGAAPGSWVEEARQTGRRSPPRPGHARRNAAARAARRGHRSQQGLGTPHSGSAHSRIAPPPAPNNARSW